MTRAGADELNSGHRRDHEKETLALLCEDVFLSKFPNPGAMKGRLANMNRLGGHLTREQGVVR